VAAGIGTAAFAVAVLIGHPSLRGYLESSIQFPYHGFEWVRALPAAPMRAALVAMVLSSLAMAAGWRYRITSSLTAILSAYFFFLDSAYYQSTGWLTVLVLGLLSFLPAHHLFALDSARISQPGRGARLALFVFRFQVAVVYVFSGVAKLNADFLSGRALRAMSPDYALARWLPSHLAYQLASCVGALFDLLIVPFLLWRRTRRAAWLALVLFHVHNALTLPVGVVPWSMLVASTVFLPPDWPRRLRLRLPPSPALSNAYRSSRWTLALVGAWMAFQVALPMRQWFYSGDAYFTEIGFHFSWALRSRRKISTTELRVVDRVTGQEQRIPFEEGLNPTQAARAAGDPYAIWWRAQRLAEVRPVAVHVESWTSLNGWPRARLIDPSVDLASQQFPLLGVPHWVRLHR
jgi:vitamin K-dependent gamma-carboxylase